MGLGPRLPNGTLPPSGLEGLLLSLFDVTGPRELTPRGETQLRTDLSQLARDLIPKQRFSELLQALLEEQLVEEVSPPSEKFVDLPSIPLFSPFDDEKPTHDLKPLPRIPLPGGPVPGDRYYSPTPKGYKPARLCSDVYSLRGLWVLGPGTEADQTVLAITRPAGTPLALIDAACATSKLESVETALRMNAQQGLVTNTPAGYILTKKALPVSVALAEKQRQLAKQLAMPARSADLPRHAECEAMLKALSEDDLVEYVVIPLLRAMGFQDVVNNGGPSEHGKDIVAMKHDELRLPSWLAVVAKKEDLTNSASSHHGLTSVLHQVQQVFDYDFVVTRSATPVKVSRCWVVTSGECLQSAREALAHQMRSRPILWPAVRWLFREDLVALVNDYVPTLWRNLPNGTTKKRRAG
jgi:hypothetical protein